MSSTRAAKRRFAFSLTAVIALVAGLVTVPAITGQVAPAAAAGSPDVQLTRTVAAHTLYGRDVSVSLQATAPDSTPDVDGFNLTLSDVLPAGATVTSTTFPITERIVQLDGTTLLVWTNVADLLDDVSVTLAYTYTYPVLGQAGQRDVGDSFAGTAHAYVNTDPYMVPNPMPTPADGSVWEDVSGSAAAASTTLLVPYLVDVRELSSPEAELLRGIHDDKTVYEITVTNNTVAPTTNPDVTAYLPASLEFLGCTAVDNSGAPEYPGSPTIAASFPALVGCNPQYTATTVTADPDGAGSMPSAVYTRVLWDQLADLPASGIIRMQYAAAIPLHANVASAADAVANLDNNTGAEANDEDGVVTYVGGAASYQGSKPVPVAFVVDDTATVTAEDVRVVKSRDNGAINQLQNTTWTLDFATSEYLQSTDPIVVTDTIPDGLDWVGSSLPLTSGPTANADGTLTVVWTVPTMAPQSTYQITYQTATRTDYRQTGEPVSANDSWTNVVDLTTSTVVRSGVLGDTSRVVATVIDHSQAGQVAEDVKRDKLIAAPVGGDCTSVTTWFDDSVAAFHPGDTVCFRLDVDFPDSLDTMRARISDYLPAGFTLVGQPYYNVPLHDLGDSVALAYTKNPAGTVLNWTKDAVDVGTYFSVILTTTISGVSTQKTDLAGNLLKVRYQNTAESTFQLRDQANAEITAPLLALDKVLVTPVSGTAEAGDAIHYRIDVTNTGKEAATDVEVRDVVPVGWTCAEVTSTTPATTCAAGVIRWTGLTVPAATATPGLLSLDVYAVAPSTAAPGDLYTNRAGVRSYEGATNSGPAQLYYPANNIDPAVTPNTDRADDTADVTVGGATITKVATSLTESGNNSATQATIGELVTFTVSATIPSGTTMYGSPSISDAVNARYSIVGTPAYTVDTDGAGPGSPSASVAASLAGSTISIPLGPVDGGSATQYANPTGSGNDVVVLTYQARVLDLATSKRTLAAIPNTATVAWQSAAGTSRSATGQAPITVVEPNITIAKTANQTTATPDSTILYTLTVTNPTGTNVSTAHEIDVVDTVPAQLIPLTTGGVTAADGDTLLGTGGGVWHSGTRTVTFPQIAAMAPGGAAVVYTFQTKVQNPTLTPGTVTNSVVATASSLADPATGERTSTSPAGTGNGNGYIFTATRVLNAPAITITKGAAPGTRTVGQKVTYTLDVTIPAGTFAYDILVRDTLAPGVRYFADPITVSCAPACSPSASATLIGAPTASDTVIGFWLDDLTASTAGRTVTIVYTGIVTTTAVTGNQQNRARVYTHTTDTVTGTPATLPGTSGYTAGNQATATIVVQRPVLAIVKKVDGLDATRAKPGQVLHYTVAVTNSGTSPAYDVTVTDTPDSDLTTYTAVGMPGATAVDTDPSDGTLSWSIAGPIAVGATVTLAYDLTAPADFDETDEVPAGYELINLADVPSYFGVPAALRTLAASYYVDYDDVAADQADVELDLASLGDRVWFDVDDDGVQDAGEPGFAGIDVTVRFAGADGTFGNADDEVVVTTTGANGYYLVQNLPGGQYRVTVDATDLPAGFAPSYDLDGIASAHSWTGALAQDGAPRTVDFGYTGAGSIGDLVWFDQDGDGVQDASEPGIAGRTVTVVWQGLDGALGTADDNTYVTSTSSTGAYSVPRLPAGSFSVTVSGMPPGFDSTKDPDVVADGTALTTLTAGQNRSDQDFGYAGAGSIGDLVWIDRDEDGSYDAAGATPEQGVAGATVQLDWHGVFGGAGDPVVATFSTTTDASGLYAFTRLVPGTYTVRVTGGLPAAATNTFDRDGNGNSQTPVTLAIGEAVADADFGYSSDSSLGQRIWWDRNGDGVQDTGEPGFPAVAVNVRWYGPNGIAGDGDDRLFATTTAADGLWSIPDLPQGTYRVSVDTADLPSGMSQTFDADGTGTANASVTVLGTGAVLTQNFGYRGALSLGDLVFLDRDADGMQDAGEPGLAGVIVQLSWAGQGLTVATVTAADGTYAFPGLVPDDYVVSALTGSLPSASLTAVSDLQGSSTDAVANLILATSRSDVDFGFRGDSLIGDLVWHDRDADGTLDADESGMPGVTVRASWAGRDGILGTTDDVQLSTVTDADGAYLFDRLPVGDWRVVLDATTLPAGFTDATFEEDATLDGVDIVALAAATDHRTADFGLRGTGSIGDRVWFDLDGDGAQDAGEPGVRGQRVDLAWAGRDGVLGTADDETWTTTTRANGAWLVEDLPDGVFRVTVNGGIADAASQTGDPDGTLDDATDVTLSAADRVEDAADFGYLGDNTLGDTVWWDEDADGAIDLAELPLAGVTVDDRWLGLDGLAATADDIVRTAVTDSLGQYAFAGAPAGEHRVTVLSGVPTGLVAVSDRDGTGAAADGASQVVLAAGLPGVSDLSHDFGYAGSGAVGDLVWLDLDTDGIEDAGEPGIPSVTVTLTWAGVNGTLGDGDDRVWTDLTDASGAYRFDGLPAGSFRIDLTDLPADRVPTADPDGAAADTAMVTLAAGEVQLTDDFGYIGDPTIGDTIFIDLDGDGAQGPLEPGLSGVVLTIRHSGADKALNTVDDIVFTVATDATGNYLVPGLPDGPVQVSYDPASLPAGYVPSSDLDGGSASDTVATLTLVGSHLDIDFAIVGDAQLHGVVFDDRNGNGVRDAGEAGVAGVDLTIEWAGPAGNVALLATTDPSGAWAFLAIPPGTYVTTIDKSTVPAGYRVDTASTITSVLPVGGNATVVMGITNAVLALTGFDPRTNIAVGLLALLAGLGALTLAARRRRRIDEQAR